MVLSKVLISKVLPGGKRPWTTQIPLCVTHSPLCKACPHAFRGNRRNLGQKTGTGLCIWVLGQHRQDVQHNTANGGFTPSPFGCFPNARGKPVWTSGPYSFAVLHFYHSSIQQWYNVTISQYIITYHTSHLIACSCSQLATDPHDSK